MDNSIRNPRWKRSGNAIDLTIEHPVYGTIEFTATATDPEKYGRDLFEMAVRGDFGTITPEGEE
jgi:hypothetical protein